MFSTPPRAIACAIAILSLPATARAQTRSGENAVTQADDAFGFSVGRESLGIYDSDNARGFSPTTAGNLRIDGLYFAPVVGLSGLLIESQSIKVGLSAQGYPFAAPSGIVDFRLRRPAEALGASTVFSTDSYGSFGLEADGSIPLGGTLSLGAAANGGRTHFADGTRNHYHSEALTVRWRPSSAIELLPFWSAFTDIDDQSSPYYIPSGAFIPPEPRAGHYPGPQWNAINRSQFNYGLLGSVALSPTWLLRIGAFRSIRHLRSGYTYLITGIEPSGLGDHRIFAARPGISRGSSGEARLTHTLVEGPRLHQITLSARGREAKREYGGDAEVDLGVSSIFEDIDSPRPVFRFEAPSHDRLRQTLYGIAYDGRWKGVGELSFGLSKSLYRKSAVAPDLTIQSRASPWLYNATLTVLPLQRVAVYGGYSRGFEESGSPPASAANRSESLPAIITRQIDGGVRVDLASVKAVAGIFDLKRPYFGFDPFNRYIAIGTTRSRGAEFSLSGNITRRMRLVAGGVILDPRVRTADGAAAAIGRRPVGIFSHLFSVDANWDVAAVHGLSLDASISHRGGSPATSDNMVSLPPRAQVDLGTRYAFTLGKVRATARFQLANLFDNRGFSVAGPGTYAPNAARSASAYLTTDF